MGVRFRSRPSSAPWVLASIAAAGLAIAILLVLALRPTASERTDSSARPGPEPAAETAAARRTKLQDDWLKAQQAVQEVRLNPGLEVHVRGLLDRFLESARGTEFEEPARRALRDLDQMAQEVAKVRKAEEETVQAIGAMIESGDLTSAARRIREVRTGTPIAPRLAAELARLTARIEERVSATYERLFAKSRQIAAERSVPEGQALLRQAMDWDVAAVAERARRDIAALPDLVLQEPAFVGRARQAFESLDARARAAEAQGKMSDAMALYRSYPPEFSRTEFAARARERIEQLRQRPAAGPAEPPAGAGEPEPGSTTTAEGLDVSKRGPQKGEYVPGGLPEGERRKRHAELTAKAASERKGAAKTAEARRRKWLQELESKHGIYDVKTLLDRGDVSKRVDVTIVTAGFPKADGSKVIRQGESIRDALLRVDPFQNYQDYVNVHLVLVDDPKRDSSRVPYRVDDGILTCDRGKAKEYAAHAPDSDLIVVLCNVTGVRSTGGGGVITLESGLDMGRTFLHEMGHAFADLSDEYANQSDVERYPLFENEDAVINCTLVSDPRKVKWHYWVQPKWETPHEPNLLPKGRRVGCFEGGYYRETGVWRPESECLMRHGEQYCVVCFEHVERQFYRLIAPLDDTKPRKSRLALWLDDKAELEVTAIRTSPTRKKQFGTFHAFSTVDAKPAGLKPRGELQAYLEIKAREIGPGDHEAGIRVDFTNDRIRRDLGWLSDSRGWKIHISPYSKPKMEGPNLVKGQIGAPLKFEMQIDNPDPARFRLEARDLPEGATFNGREFSWTPPKEFQGAWRLRFVLTDGLWSAEKTVEIAALDASDRNFPPIIMPLDPVGAEEGQELELALPIADVDGDNLVITSPSLPEGAELDAYTGVLKWKPGPSQAGAHRGIPIEVFDGQKRVKGTIDILVEDHPASGGDDFDVLLALRSDSSSARLQGLGSLESYASVFRFMEAARLLRDKDADVRAEAYRIVREMAAAASPDVLAIMTKDLWPHAWHFTDNPEVLQWLAELAERAESVGPAKPFARDLKASLKAIQRYNKSREVP